MHACRELKAIEKIFTAIFLLVNRKLMVMRFFHSFSTTLPRCAVPKLFYNFIQVEDLVSVDYLKWFYGRLAIIITIKMNFEYFIAMHIDARSLQSVFDFIFKASKRWR